MLCRSVGEHGLDTHCVVWRKSAAAEPHRPHRHRSESFPEILAVVAAALPVRGCEKIPGSHLGQEPSRTTNNLAPLCLVPPDPEPSPAFHRSAHTRPPSSPPTWRRRAARASWRSVPSTAPFAIAGSLLHGAPERSAPASRTRGDRHSEPTRCTLPNLAPACSVAASAVAAAQWSCPADHNGKRRTWVVSSVGESAWPAPDPSLP